MKKAWLLPGMAILNAIVLLLQNLVMHGRVPEVTRYFEQGIVLFVPLAVWWVLRLRRGRQVLRMLVLLLGVAFVVTAVKRSIPGSRRYAQLQACEWAADVIRQDWKGPRMDAENPFSSYEYHQPNRPVIESQDARVVLLAGGRPANPERFGERDRAEYVFCDGRNYEKPEVGSYGLVAKKMFGERTFVVYRRER